jgi:hypothetical protein
VKYKKQKHGKFAGFRLWEECMKGNKEAWKEMQVYNNYDVLSLEELFYIMLPWSNKINFSVFNDGQFTCGCSSTSHFRNGFYYTKTGKFQRYRCSECGAEHRGKKNLISKDKRTKMIKR